MSVLQRLQDERRHSRLGNCKQPSVLGVKKGWCGKRVMRLNRKHRTTQGTLDFTLQAAVGHWRTRVGQRCSLEVPLWHQGGGWIRSVPQEVFPKPFASWFRIQCYFCSLGPRFLLSCKLVQSKDPVFPSAQFKFAAKTPEESSSDLFLSLLWSDVTITFFSRSVLSTGLLYLFYCTFLGMSRKWCDVKCKGHGAVGSGSEM